MTSIQPVARRVARLAFPAAALVALSLVQAQTPPSAFKPTVLHKFGGLNNGGAKPMVPPVLASDGRLYGHTFLGASPVAPAFWGQGTSYGLDAVTGSNFRSELLGSIYTGSTPLVPTAQGGFLVAGTGAYAADPTSYLTSPVIFNIKDGKASALPAPSFAPLGSMALDNAGNLYTASGAPASSCGTTTTANILWRLNADQSYAKVLDFCQYAEVQGRTQLHPKGGSPVASVWSNVDQALYVLTAISATGVYDSTRTTDYQGRAVGTLVKLGKAAIDAGIAGNGTLDAGRVELLHTFMRARDGEPAAQGQRIVGMVEAGEWLYGTTQFNAPTAGGMMDTRYGGTLWRVKKSDPSSFAVVHYFRGSDTLANDGTAQADGSAPAGPLVLAADGNIYGTTARDGSTVTVPRTGAATPVGAGTLFRIKLGTAADRADDGYEVLHRFDLGTEGGIPTGLTLGSTAGGVQKLYGAMAAGGGGETVSSTVQDNPGNGTVFSFDVALPTAKFSQALTASVTTATVGASIQLNWATTQAGSCTASGDWSGAQQTTASLVPVTIARAGENSYTLTCASQNDGQPVTSSVTVQGTSAAVVTPPATDNGSSGGGGGGGPLSAWLLAPLAALVWTRRRAAQR